MIHLSTMANTLVAIPTASLWGLWLALAAGWCLLLIWRPRWLVRFRHAWYSVAVRLVVGVLALWLSLQVLARHTELRTSWPAWTLALLGSACVEAVIWLYRLERRVVSRPTGMAMTGLRVLLVLLVIAMLAQPTWSTSTVEREPRHVAVLVDMSASSRVRDGNLPAAEKVRLAEMLNMEGLRRPIRTESVVALLRKQQQRLEQFSLRPGAIGTIARAARPRQRQMLEEDLRIELPELIDSFSRIRDRLSELLEQTDRSWVEQETRLVLEDVNTRIASPVAAELRRLAAELETDGSETVPAKLAESLARTTGTVEQLVGQVEQAGLELDAQFYQSLPQDVRRRVDWAVDRERLELARRVLESESGRKLQDRFACRFYSFDSRSRRIRPDQVEALAREAASTQEATPAAGTDLAGALKRVADDSDMDRLAGVVVLSDVQHNASRPAGDAVQRFVARGVPMSFVVLGSRVAPTDAAIVRLDAPESIFLGEQVSLQATVRFRRLAGKEAEVMLWRDGEAVDRKQITVDRDSQEQLVELTHQPSRIGRGDYRVEIKPVDGEYLTANNRRVVPVDVTEDRLKVLLIDGRPRWEYRYLKNLFAGRDEAVRLQHVLIHPDYVAGRQVLPVIHAHAAREEPEATALPETLEDWMEFDVVILGDVAPDVFGEQDARALHRFVTRRGGSLVAIAGRDHMPHSWPDGPVKSLLPATCESAAGEGTTQRSWQIELTPTGREADMLRLDADPDRSRKLWLQLPPMYWRCPVRSVKPTARVLAYARTSKPPKEPDEQYILPRALMIEQNVEAGKVLLLTTDRTWRFRYRRGDRLHHRFWGQVLRWAAEDRLRAGDRQVRIGTDRIRYTPDQQITVKARIADADGEPLSGLNVTARVSRHGKAVLRRKLRPRPARPGFYKSSFGMLPAGKYTVELEHEPVPALPAEATATARTEFDVVPDTFSEQVELTANWPLANELAGATGGKAVPVYQAERILTGLGRGTVERTRTREYAFWDSWLLLVLIVGFLTAEWAVRKKASLP